jgi:class 3 adenylate cyclase/tetratricopeptide (TPR) repeat protein
VVTVLFCDVVGSTALGESVDPEALQMLLARYFERMSAIVESHGGTVEKFIGDAVMAVFGVPVAHEDDALRACHAAVEMRDALPDLGVQGRIGVNTGEVLTGTEERLATGDAVNVAARLEQAAAPGEVLIGTETLALVGLAVEVGDERSLELKGKSEPVVGYPLDAVREAAERSHASHFVGRERELQQLVDAWHRALAEPQCELVTVVGDPGVGKSRLVAEALARIDARVVRGGCLSYGEGITYWPVVEVVRQLDALPSDEAAATAIRSLLGENDAGSGTDEIGWAFRKLIEEQAPLVVVFDDIQWAEETLLKLVEAAALLSTGAPLLLLCMARPELLDSRPGWPAVLRLEPLPEEDAGALVGEAVPDDVRERIVRASGGNPLFLTEMAALGEDAEVPATLRALLAARLDQLDEAERRVLERGAIEGELFHRGTVQALAPEEDEVTSRLAALVRRDLVRPERPQLALEDAYRFRHLLIRDAAYDALPKVTRADLHRRFAAWLEEHGQSLVELDEILGYHLEQAHRYRVELGIGGEETAELARRAGERLTVAGERAFLRLDAGAASVLLERACVVATPADRPPETELLLIRTRVLTGEFERALAAADEAIARAQQAGDRPRELRLTLTRGQVSMMRGASPEGLRPLIEEALQVFTAAGDDMGLAEAWDATARIEHNACRWAPRLEAVQRAALHAERAGNTRLVRLFQSYKPASYVFGPFSVEQALAVRAHHSEDWVSFGALLAAYQGDFAQARAQVAAAVDAARDKGRHTIAGSLAMLVAEIELLAGVPERAADAALAGVAELEELGERGWMSTVACWAAEALYQLDRDEEALALTDKAEESAARDDISTRTLILEVRAKLLSGRGKHADAQRLAREAVQIADTTDSLSMQGDALASLARVLEAAGCQDEAISAWSEALDRYERKQILPLARRVRERLDALQLTHE